MELTSNGHKIDVRRTGQNWPSDIRCRLVFKEEGRDGKRYLETETTMIWLKQDHLEREEAPRTAGDVTAEELQEIFNYFMDRLEQEEDVEVEEVVDLNLTEERKIRRVEDK